MEENQETNEVLTNENYEQSSNEMEFEPKDKKGISIAALVLGISSMVGWLISAGIVIVCGILAIIFGVFGRKNGPGAGKGMATAGLVLGIISLSFIVIAFLFGFILGLSKVAISL